MGIEIVGSEGSMGRRFYTILKYLKEDLIIRTDPSYEGANKTCGYMDTVIVATPTDTHFEVVWDLLGRHGMRRILCEKPVCKNPEHILALIDRARFYGVDVRMCCNWKYAINLALTRAQKIAVEGEMEIEYNYYDSGKDGFFWDCIQLIHLAGRFKYDRTRPAFEAKVNGIDVTLEHIHASYVLMVSEWLHGDKGKLWSLEDALKATKKVELAMGLAVSEVAGELNFGKVTQ